MDECTLYNYADDNSFSCKAPTIDAMISNLHSDGNRAIKWFTDNRMQANPEKFQFMMISRDEDSSRSLTLNDSTIIFSEDHVKVLGVVIDSKLNFSLHVSTICNKASRQLNALVRISNYLVVLYRMFPFIICLILMNYLMEFYFIGFVNAHLPGCFCPWTFRLNIGLNTSPSDSFVSYLNSHQGYSAGEFQALQLIVLAVFGAVD